MKGILLGLSLGYWLKDKIDFRKTDFTETTKHSRPLEGNTRKSNMTDRLYLVGAAFVAGLIALLLDWYFFLVLCVIVVIAGFAIIVLPHEEYY